MILPHFLDWNVTSVGGNARSRRAGTFLEEKMGCICGNIFCENAAGIPIRFGGGGGSTNLGPLSETGPLKLELGNSIFTRGGFGGAARALEPLLPDTHANGHGERVAALNDQNEYSWKVRFQGWDGMNSRKKYEPDLRNSQDPRNPFPRAWEPDFPRILILVIQCL